MPRHGQHSSSSLPTIPQLRSMLDDLEEMAEARSCLQQNGCSEYARRIPVQRDMKRLLDSVQEMIQQCQQATDSDDQDEERSSVMTVIGKRQPSTVRIQLKLSPDLVRVLQTVRQNHVKASELVESVLWESPRVRDTARLAGIRRPRQAPAA